MKKFIITILFISVASWAWADISGNALMPNLLPKSESGRINVLENYPSKVLTHKLSGSEKIHESTIIFEYVVQNSKLTKHIAYNQGNEESPLVYDYIYSPQILEVHRSIKNTDDYEKFKFYFEDNKLVKKENYWDGETLSKFYTFNYSSDNLLTSIRETYSKTGHSEDYFRYSYIGDKISKLKTSNMTLRYEYADNVVTVEDTRSAHSPHKYIRQYDDNGNLLNEIYYSPTGQFLYFEHTFTYDEQGRIDTYQYLNYNDPNNKYEFGGNYVQEFVYDETYPKREDIMKPTELSNWNASSEQKKNDLNISEERQSDKTPFIKVISGLFLIGISVAVTLTVVIKKRK